MNKEENKKVNEAIVELPCVMLIVGRRKSGKTRLLVKMLLDDKFLKNKFDKIIIVSPTFLLDGNWRSISSDGIDIYTKYDDDIVEELITSQKQSGAEESVLLILDDCVNEDIKKENLEILACNGRHLNVTLIVLTQKITSISTTIRANFDQILHFYTASKRERQNLSQEVEIPDDVFLLATKERYTFINCINRGGVVQLYKNFSEKISYNQ